MRKTEWFEVGGTRFEVTQLAAGRSLALMNKMLAAVAPALAKAAGESVAGQLGAGKLNVSALLALDAGRLVAGVADGVGELFDRMKPGDFEAIVTELLSTVRVVVRDDKGDKIEDLVTKSSRGLGLFDEVFSGRLLDMLELARFALRLNYADFYEALGVQRMNAERAISQAGTVTSASSYASPRT